MDDVDALMCQAQAGDAESYAQLIEQVQHLLRAVMLRECGDVELADELAQDALVRGWERRDQYRPGTSPRAWLLAIARSQLMENYRRHDRDRRHLKEVVRQELLRHTPRVDDTSALRLEALQQCLAGLGPEQRQILDLAHAKDLPSEDAAAILGIRTDAYRQRLSRLQRRLKICAEERIAKALSKQPPVPSEDES